MRHYVRDEQTGEVFKLHPEGSKDSAAATASAVYLLLMLALFFWLLFDIWIGRYSLARWLGYQDTIGHLNGPTFRLMAYTIIGGGLGGIVNGIRSLLFWHGDLQAFGGRYLWKYVNNPWLGATLALFVYAIIRSGIAVFGGDSSTQAAGTSQSLSTLAVGVLAGYGSRQVFIWLDVQVNKLFKVTPAAQASVPDLLGKTRQEAEDILKDLKIVVGNVTEEVPADPTVQEGTVIKQNPVPHSSMPKDGAVNFTIASRKGVTVPNLIGKSRKEAESMLKDAKLTPGNVAEEVQDDAAVQEDTVIKQKPAPDSNIDAGGAVDLTVAIKKAG